MSIDSISLVAYIDDFSMITIVANKPFSIIPSLSLVDDKGTAQPLTIDKQEHYHEQIIYKCKTSTPFDLFKEYWITYNDRRIPLMVGSIVRTEKFDTLFTMIASLARLSHLSSLRLRCGHQLLMR